MSAEPETLHTWRALLARPLADLRPMLDESAIRDAVYYGSTGPLTLVRDPDVFPGALYFEAGKPVLAYIEAPSRLARDLTDEALLTLVGQDAPTLRSRAGKFARTHVAAQRGIAVAEINGAIAYLELFPPTSFEAYRERLHQEPPEFIR